MDQPSKEDLPTIFPSPFGRAHPIAEKAAEILKEELSTDYHGVTQDFQKKQSGKMFGVLVVADSKGRIGFLRGVSGMLDNKWKVEGFVPPLFSEVQRDLFWPQGQKALRESDEEIAQWVQSGEKDNWLLEEKEWNQKQEMLQEVLMKKHASSKENRAEIRASLLDESCSYSDNDKVVLLQKLSKQSQSQRQERKEFLRNERVERKALEGRKTQWKEEVKTAKKKRASLSNSLLVKIQGGYELVNAKGENCSLADVFLPKDPPGGAGDCAAPKLLGFANKKGLRVIALAEFWWGCPPLGGARHHGFFYPACRSKCGPLLPFLMEGIPHEEAPIYGTMKGNEEEPRTVFENDEFLVVDKPSGMLSVPGVGEDRHDSVLTRICARGNQEEPPILCHRLDLDTSGLLMFAKGQKLYQAVQKMFARRTIEKRYIAWVQGDVLEEKGLIRLALRVDLDDRPRQIHDAEHGKDAITVWRVLSKIPGFTEVEFMPRTGRTHQLRVHAALIEGLGAPIVGDRLYGGGGTRLLLHAASLRFKHPLSGQKMRFHSPVPKAFEEWKRGREDVQPTPH